MKIDSSFYMHEADIATLKALQAIPVFSQAIKAFMKVWNEKAYALENMSTNIKLGENQLPEYYNMLPPICEKLGIEVPDLYLCNNVVPNAYTCGENKPFIVLHSGLLKVVPHELIPTVLAHECGHIACHHVLYHTMGGIILNGALLGLNQFGLAELALTPLNYAFSKWSRCSEFSADRAAILCDGSADKLIRLNMIFSGVDKEFADKVNKEAYMEQAIEYKKMVDEDKLNKYLEFTKFGEMSHPLNVVRAYEGAQWAQTEDFANIQTLSVCKEGEISDTTLLPVTKASHECAGAGYEEIQQMFEQTGFKKVKLNRVTAVMGDVKEGQVVSVNINGNEIFSKNTWIPANSEITITYFENKTAQELCAEHPGAVRLPAAARSYKGKNYVQIVEELKALGFENFRCEPRQDPKLNWLLKDGMIERISINNVFDFKQGDWVSKDAVVFILYHCS